MAENVLRFNIKQNDVYPTLRATLYASDDKVDLTDAESIRFIMRNRKQGLKVDAPMVVLDQTGEDIGGIEYHWSSSDTDSVGDYQAEIEVTWGPGETQTFPTSDYIRVRVYKELD